MIPAIVGMAIVIGGVGLLVYALGRYQRELDLYKKVLDEWAEDLKRKGLDK